MELLDRYEALKQKVIDRKEAFDCFIAWLEGETTWLTSPASTRYHLAEEQGLLKHSVGVADTLLRFYEALAPAIPEESCVIVGLFHDAGKLGMPGKPLYLPNENEWLVKNRGIRYKINPDVVAMGLAVRNGDSIEIDIVRTKLDRTTTSIFLPSPASAVIFCPPAIKSGGWNSGNGYARVC